jgi:uncharacterized protein (DUF952 family)
MSQLLYHIAPAKDIERAARSGRYAPPSLETDGFVHCSYAQQVGTIAARLFRGHTNLLLLEIDPNRLEVPVVAVRAADADDVFPHVYGPLPMSAVLAIRELRCRADGSFDMPCIVDESHTHETELDRYLGERYLNAAAFAAACDIASDELRDLVRRELIPEPSYVVHEGTLTSYVFGTMPAPGSKDGEYFHPAMAPWVAKARYDVVTHGIEGAHERARNAFVDEFAAALRALNASLYRLTDAFDASGNRIPAGLNARLDSAWEHFRRGTFGLCVANPVDALAIARKEVLQEKLTAATQNGAKRSFDAAEIPAIRQLIDDYAESSMPFSPIEYSRSSRKRLVDDLRRAVGYGP